MTGQNEPFGVADYLEISDLYSAVDILRTKGWLTTEVEADVTGFRLIGAEEKEELIGVPFLVVSAILRHDHKKDSDYVDVMLVTADDRRIWLRDSSQGVFQQFLHMFRVVGENRVHGVWVRRGLRYEENPFIRANGETVMARTYYMKNIIPRQLRSDVDL